MKENSKKLLKMEKTTKLTKLKKKKQLSSPPEPSIPMPKTLNHLKTSRSFVAEIPHTTLAISATERKDKNFSVLLHDLTNDWKIVLYRCIAAEVLGTKIERILTK
jgi:hypothetical protein